MTKVLLYSVAIGALIAYPTATKPPASQSEEARNAVMEFGEHKRPWARDLLAEAPSGGAAPAIAPAGAVERIEAAIAADLAGGRRVFDAPRIEALATLALLKRQAAAFQTRQAELDDQRALTALAQRRVREETEALLALRDEVNGLIDELATKEDENLDEMASLYGTMKTKDAARLLEDMSTEEIGDIVERMETRTAAGVLGKMDE
ncbi:MAG: hypothetical protein AAF527_08290, partial [Pseudomonadota bacterium]